MHQFEVQCQNCKQFRFLNVPKVTISFIHSYLPTYMYPNDTLPRYALGVGYVISQKITPKLLHASFLEPFLNMEDIFVTGILAKKINVVPTLSFLWATRPYWDICAFRGLVVVQIDKVRRMMKIIKELFTNTKQDCQVLHLLPDRWEGRTVWRYLS